MAAAAAIAALAVTNIALAGRRKAFADAIVPVARR
jgi:hypothetical protein